MLHLAQLYGHHHKDKIHMLYTRDEYPLPDPQQYKTALLMSPSITPIYKNSPAFRVFAYNQKEGNLYNYTQYYMDLASSNGRKVGHFFLQIARCVFERKCNSVHPIFLLRQPDEILRGLLNVGDNFIASY